MKEQHYHQGCALLAQFCAVNWIELPRLVRLAKTDRLYHLATCAYYRPTQITIMVEKCAAIGHAASAWSCPGYAVDRTPYGVLQHELGHHVDYFLTDKLELRIECMFSRWIYARSLEKPLTGYLGTDNESVTFYKEWFAEIFRLFVTNPDLLSKLRPKAFSALCDYVRPVVTEDWRAVLNSHNAPARTMAMAQVKVDAVAAGV